ncbi:MAG: sigma-70 family RNA polymerase sigma factor, partial [Bacteroidales bacterium]|nr:sigma-70 family RNA polymerase sigma factor [Bacteroidales bacterium]
VKNEYRNRQVRQEHEKKISEELIDRFDVNKENVDKNNFNQHLETELNKLDVDLKTIFYLRFREDMSIKEIAEIVNCPEGTIKSRLFYLSKQLSRKLSYYYILK